MKARSIKNPLKFIVNNKRVNKNNKLLLDDVTDHSSASFSVDGGAIGKNSSRHQRTLPIFRVSFADDDDDQEEEFVQYYECHHDLTVEEVASELWYSAEQLQEFKKDNAYSLKVARSAANLGASSASSSFLTALDHVYESCARGQVPTPQEQATLQKLLQLQPARTGLENKVLRQMSEDRQERREQQMALVGPNGVVPSHPDASPREVALLMRTKCCEISKPAVLFATEIAKAQQPSC